MSCHDTFLKQNETQETKPVKHKFFQMSVFAVCEFLVNAGYVMQKPSRNRSRLGNESSLVLYFSSADQAEKGQNCFVRLVYGKYGRRQWRTYGTSTGLRGCRR